jgi:hypothetical protein
MYKFGGLKCEMKSKKKHAPFGPFVITSTWPLLERTLSYTYEWQNCHPTQQQKKTLNNLHEGHQGIEKLAAALVILCIGLG